MWLWDGGTTGPAQTSKLSLIVTATGHKEREHSQETTNETVDPVRSLDACARKIITVFKHK